MRLSFPKMGYWASHSPLVPPISTVNLPSLKFLSPPAEKKTKRAGGRDNKEEREVSRTLTPSPSPPAAFQELGSRRGAPMEEMRQRGD